MNGTVEVQILPNGKVLARRRDGLPLTAEDRVIARRIAENLGAKPETKGITVADVLRVFAGARIIEQPITEPKPATCTHCDKPSIPAWRRGGKIVPLTEVDGQIVWSCHLCGRRCETKRKRDGRNQPS